MALSHRVTIAECLVAIGFTVVSAYELGTGVTVAVLLLLSTLCLMTTLYPHVFSLKAMSLVSITVNALLVLIVVPSIWLAHDLNTVWASQAVAASVVATVLVGAGGILVEVATRRLSHGGLSLTLPWHEWKGITEADSAAASAVFVSLGVVALGVSAYYLSVVPGIPLLALAMDYGGRPDLLQMREASLKLLPMPTVMRYLLSWTREVFLPVLSAGLLVRYMAHRHARTLGAFVLAVLWGFFMAGINTEKAPVVRLAIILVLAYAFASGRPLRLSVVLPIGLGVVALPFLVYVSNAIALGAANPYVQAIRNLVSRVLIVPARVAMIHYEVFPQQVDFLYGASINGLAQVQGKALFPLANYLYVNHYPWGVPSNASGYANAAFSSEMWANFGWPGVVASSLVIGVVLQVVTRWIRTRANTPLGISVYASMAMAVVALISANMTTVFITQGFVLLVIMALAGTRKRRRGVQRGNHPSQRYSNGHTHRPGQSH